MSDTEMSRVVDEVQPGSFTRGRLTLLLYGMAVAFGFSVAALGPAMPSLREELGISRTVGGLHFSALAVGSVLSGFMVERIIGRRGRRWVFWWGGAGVATGALVIGVGWHPAVTLSGALVVGGFGVAMLAVSSATLSNLHPSHRGVALTEFNTASSAGSVVPALLIGALLAVGAGWRPAFAAPLAIWIVLAVRRHAETFPPAAPQPDPGHRPQLRGAYWFYWGAFTPAVAAEWAFGAWGAGYLVDVAGSTEEAASLLMASFFGAMLVGRLLGGLVARTVGAFPLLLGAAGVGLAGHLLFWSSESVPAVVGGLLVAGLGISMMFPMLLSLAIGAAQDRSDVAASRVFIAAGGAVLVAPVTLGVIADHASLRAAFGTVPLLFVLVVLLVALGRRADRPTGSDSSSSPEARAEPHADGRRRAR